MLVTLELPNDYSLTAEAEKIQRLKDSMTSLGMDNVSPLKLREYLRQRFDVYTAERAMGIKYPADPHGVEGIRVSTHYYNTFEQVERVLQGLRELSSGKQ